LVKESDAGVDADSEADGVSEVLSVASDDLSLDPQAVRAKLRMAVPAISFVHVAVLDRFTG
jgi:hypothetical protein